MSPSFLFLLILTSVIFLFSAYFKKIKALIIQPFWNFKIFLIFSFGFSYISSRDLEISLFFLLKVVLLILLSVLFNYFTDFKYLISTIDAYLSSINSRSVKIPLRKAFFAFLLSIEFIRELFAEGKMIAESNDKASDKGFLSKHTNVLNCLFHYSFRKAEEMESEYSVNTDFSSAKSAKASFGFTDFVIIGFLMIEIILFLAVK